MRRRILAALLWMVAAPAVLLMYGLWGPQAEAAPTESKSFVVERPLAEFFHELDERERREQVRDWAVIGTLTHLGASAEQLARATYESPPARLPYLEELYSFERGRGRRAYLGRRVLLFRDADDPDPQATIGRLADRVRMESGELPRAIEIYLVQDDLDTGVIRIERAADVTTRELFSSAYGYVEAKVGDEPELTRWLAQVDDLALAKMEPDGRLKVGGRRFAKTRTANLTSEDVAAIYQARLQLAAAREGALAAAKALPEATFARASQRVDLEKLLQARWHVGGQQRRDLLADLPPYEQAILRRAFAAAGKDDTPGFSLDPEWLPDPKDPSSPLVLSKLRALSSHPCKELQQIVTTGRVLLQTEPDESRRSARAGIAEGVMRLGPMLESEEVCRALQAEVPAVLASLVAGLQSATPESWESALVEYHLLMQALRAEIESSPGVLNVAVYAALEFYQYDSRVQCARYEGLAGTRVGMTLFYTDLLAKLWESTDFGYSAPVLAVPGFRSTPHQDLPVAYQEEVDKNPSTRIWFGPRATSVSRRSEGRGVDAESSFLFEHRFTKIYAAGRNPASPGQEVSPNESSRRTIGWWDSHFDDVADHEQEYHRQNQIMKWALVTAAFDDGGRVAKALASHPVRRDHLFASWQAANRRALRFSEQLPALHAAIPGRECIPILASYSFSTMGGTRSVTGGVSTVQRGAARALPALNRAAPLGARKPFVADLGQGTAGSATRPRPVLRHRHVTFEGGGMSLRPPVVKFVGDREKTKAVEILAGKGEGSIGSLRAEPTRAGTRLDWKNGAVENQRLNLSQSAARSEGSNAAPSAVPTRDAADQLAKAGKVTAAARAYEQVRAGPATVESPVDRLAREVVGDVARGRPQAALNKLNTLARKGKLLSPEARKILRPALTAESPAVARRFEQAITKSLPLNHQGESLSVHRGRLAVQRDVGRLEVRRAPIDPQTDLSKHVVYMDDRLRSSREGLLPEVSGRAAFWQRQRGVKLQELDASAIGAAPDLLRETSTGLVAGQPMGRGLSNIPHPRVFLLRRCDSDQSTQATDDDC